jgi:hypothetical protein
MVPAAALRAHPSKPPFAGATFAGMPADDDDWVGTPPEGRHTRDRANPAFWQNQWQAAAAGSVLLVLVVIVLLLALL